MKKSPNTLTLKGNLTIKQRKWIKEYIATGNATEAAIRVYDTEDRNVAHVIGSENLQKLTIDNLMEEMGLTDVALINVGAEGMTKPVKQSITGEVYPDYGVRHRYWETMLKLKKKLENKQEGVSGNIFNISYRYENGLNSTSRSGTSSSTGSMERSNEIQDIGLASES